MWPRSDHKSGLSEPGRAGASWLNLPAQPSSWEPLQVIYFSPAVSLFLVHVLEFLITSKELTWNSLYPSWRVSHGLAGQAGPCCAPCREAGGCSGSPSNKSTFVHPTDIRKQPHTEQRLVFFLCWDCVFGTAWWGLSQWGLCKPSHTSWGCSKKGEAPHACASMIFTSATAQPESSGDSFCLFLPPGKFLLKRFIFGTSAVRC